MRVDNQESDGAPGAIRTPDLLIRSQMLYPAELRVREVWYLHKPLLFSNSFFDSHLQTT